MAKRWFDRRGLIIGLLVAVVAVAGYQPTVASVALNVAQIDRLHGSYRVELLRTALRIAPDHAQLRWQTGASLAELGEHPAAAETLLPLAIEGRLPDGAARTLFASLIEAGQAQQLASLDAQLRSSPWLPPRTAAAVTHAYLESQGLLTRAQAERLLAPALGLSPAQPEFLLIAGDITTKAFWGQPEGRRLRSLLADMARPSTVQPRSQTELSGRVAELLDVPTGVLRLGEELIVNGDAEVVSFCLATGPSCFPAGWSPTFMSNGDPWNRATFGLAGEHARPFSQATSLRIDGVLIEHEPTREPARAGFWHEPIVVHADRSYVISFVYRTEGVGSDGAGLWVSADPLVFFAGEYMLPPTAGSWRRMTLVAWNRRPVSATVRPLLRLWGEGTVWFDEVSMRELVLDGALSPGEARLQIGDP